MYRDSTIFDSLTNIKLKKNDLICTGRNKFIVQDYLGCGTFADVYKIEDLYSNNQFAIKIFKSGTCYLKVGMNEAFLLKKLRNYRNHFVVFYEEFFYKQHFCIVEQLLSNNLYEFIKYTNHQGFDHGMTKNIAIQLLNALFILQMEGITHGDIKPENICLDRIDDKSFKVKIIDLGSSFIQPKKNSFYIQSRYYRAPETILGLNYGHGIDLWSFGCVIYEIFTGLPLFPGKSNKEQIMRYTKLLGMPPVAMLENGKNAQLYFYKKDDDMAKSCGTWHNFYDRNEDTFGIVTNKENNTDFLDNTAGFAHPGKSHDYKMCYGETNDDKDYLTMSGFRKSITSRSKNKIDNANFIDFLLSILKMHPMERPIIEDLKEHPYLVITDIRHKRIQNLGKAHRNIVNPLPQEQNMRRKSEYGIRTLKVTNQPSRKFSVHENLSDSEEDE